MAAAEIFGAVEKTLIEYQGEISRSKQEVDHLRTLVLWPEIRLHRSAVHQFSPHHLEKEASPECPREEEWASHVSPDHPSTLHIKEEYDQRADRGAVSDPIASPQLVRGEDNEEPPSHLYRILTAEQAAGIKSEPDGDVSVTSPSVKGAEISCGINPEFSGLQQQTLIDRLEVTHHEQDGPVEEHYAGGAWSPCRDHEDPHPPQIKVEKFTSSSPKEDNVGHCKVPPQSESSVFDKPHSLSPRHNQSVTNQTFYTAEIKRRDAGGEDYDLSGLTRVSQPFYSVSQSEYGENTEGVVNGEWIHVLTPTKPRPKTRQRSSLYIGAEQNINDLSRERRHTCPICAKRFKESSHLKDHLRIHTGEKPYRCKECGMNFRQSGALTLHKRIHTGERPYQCAFCGRRFNRKGDMQTHKIIHTGERPHLCLVCGKDFKRKSNLNTHLKIHA